MFDTVRCYIELEEELDATVFDGYRAVLDSTKTSDASVRHWLNDNVRGDYEPRAEWYHAVGREGILAVTFSVAKMARRIYDNVSMSDADAVLDDVNEWLATTFAIRLPDIREWRVTRVDYAWNFQVADRQQLKAYVAMLRACNIGSMSRSEFGSYGVVWKNGSRWVKFYDKGQERGDHKQTVLRFEVSHLNAGVKYMCKREGIERDVRSLVDEGIAVASLHRWFGALGLDNHAIYERDEYTLSELRSAFGRGAMSAMTALRLIATSGSDSYKLGAMSSSSFYRWRARLRSAGFLPMSGVSLPALSLPVSESEKST